MASRKVKYTAPRLVSFSPDEVILAEGEYNEEMYKIIRGNALLYTGYQTEQEVLIGAIGPNKFFGEFGLLIGQPSAYTVVAYTEVYAVLVSESTLEDFIRDNNTSVIDLLRNMANTMITMGRHIEMLSEDLVALQKNTAAAEAASEQQAEAENKAEKQSEREPDQRPVRYRLKETVKDYVLYKPGGVGAHGKMHSTKTSSGKNARRSRF